jgi:hypothetical protein
MNPAATFFLGGLALALSTPSGRLASLRVPTALRWVAAGLAVLLAPGVAVAMGEMAASPWAMITRLSALVVPLWLLGGAAMITTCLGKPVSRGLLWDLLAAAFGIALLHAAQTMSALALSSGWGAGQSGYEVMVASAIYHFAILAMVCLRLPERGAIGLPPVTTSLLFAIAWALCDAGPQASMVAASTAFLLALPACLAATLCLWLVMRRGGLLPVIGAIASGLLAPAALRSIL